MNPGDVTSYLEMCASEGVNLQRGMNFRLRGDYSVILMSLRPNSGDTIPISPTTDWVARPHST